MINAKEYDISHILYGSSWLLHNIYNRVLEDNSPYHFLAKEGEEVCVDRGLSENLLAIEATVNQ
jgi:hypothetical protein